MSAVDQWHVRMLNDRRRNIAFKAAIKHEIDTLRQKIDGVTVLDIGCGTGLLSLFALEAGASRIHAVEHDETMAQIAENVLRDTRTEKPDLNLENISLHKCSSFDLTTVKRHNECSSKFGHVPAVINSPIDLIVAEVLDAGIFGEGILSAVHDSLVRLARRKDKMPCARVIPANVHAYATLVQSDHIRCSHFCQPSSSSTDMALCSRVARTRDQPYTSAFVATSPGEAIFPVTPFYVKKGENLEITYEVSDRWSNCSVTTNLDSVNNFDIVLCDEELLRRLNDGKWVQFAKECVMHLCKEKHASPIVLLGRYVCTPSVLSIIASLARMSHFAGTLYAVEVSDSGAMNIIKMGAPHTMQNISILDEHDFTTVLQEDDGTASFCLLDPCKTTGEIDWSILVQLLHLRLACGAYNRDVTVVPSRITVNCAMMHSDTIRKYATLDVSGQNTCGFKQPALQMNLALQSDSAHWHLDANLGDFSDAKFENSNSDGTVLFELDLCQDLDADSEEFPGFIKGAGSREIVVDKRDEFLWDAAIMWLVTF